MESVYQTIIKKIIFVYARVPDELRSDNTPELMQGIVRRGCEYLNIAQIVTGDHNPRDDAMCEGMNQTLGFGHQAHPIRKCSRPSRQNNCAGKD